MTVSSEAAEARQPASVQEPIRRFALLGNPNTGKTTLFNRLCGLRAKTANYPGVTADARVGRLELGGVGVIELTDLPGLYSLDLELPEAEFCRDAIAGRVSRCGEPHALLAIADASNLRRNLALVLEVIALGKPTVIALNMIDEAERRALRIDVTDLERRLGCPVVAINARNGSGIGGLLSAVKTLATAPTLPSIQVPVSEDDRSELVEELVSAVTTRDESVRPKGRVTDWLDRVFVHPVLGMGVFAAVMSALFMVIFILAQHPMGWIESAFSWLGGAVSSVVSEGVGRDFLVDGVIGGVAGTVVFLPQICLLFFLLSILEDTGYLARAAFLADGVLRRFGLPGTAFVPLLSSHACALPGIMSARLIPDPRERLATILVAPFMSCSARIPVYVLLITLLFPGGGWRAGLAFVGCYVLGAVVALLTAILVRRTVLTGGSKALLIELPSYKLPSLRNALLTTWDKGTLFLRNAGTVILTICIVLWALSAFPRSDAPPEVATLREASAVAASEGRDQVSAELSVAAGRLENRAALRYSIAGRIGVAAEPVFAPLGYDWQVSIAVLTSFAAREVFVSTMLVMLGLEEDGDVENPGLVRRVRDAERDDGSPVFAPATTGSLLVFYVLAMQCLPTLAVTRRAAGGWKWALIQLFYMTAVAYVAAWVTFLIASQFI